MTDVKVPLAARIGDLGIDMLSTYDGVRETPAGPVHAWLCVLSRNEWRSIGVTFLAGPAYGHRPPRMVEVLTSVLLEVRSVLTYPVFEDWAAMCDYDPDSRRAETVFREIQATAGRLAYLLDSHLDEMVWETEYGDD